MSLSSDSARLTVSVPPCEWDRIRVELTSELLCKRNLFFSLLSPVSLFFERHLDMGCCANEI